MIVRTNPEKIRVPLRGKGVDSQRALFRLEKSDRGPINWHDVLEGLADRVEEAILCQVRDNGVVDLKKRAITLCASQDSRTELRAVHVAQLSGRESPLVFARKTLRRQGYSTCSCSHIVAQERS